MKTSRFLSLALCLGLILAGFSGCGVSEEPVPGASRDPMLSETVESDPASTAETIPEGFEITDPKVFSSESEAAQLCQLVYPYLLTHQEADVYPSLSLAGRDADLLYTAYLAEHGYLKSILGDAVPEPLEPGVWPQEELDTMMTQVLGGWGLDESDLKARGVLSPDGSTYHLPDYPQELYGSYTVLSAVQEAPNEFHTQEFQVLLAHQTPDGADRRVCLYFDRTRQVPRLLSVTSWEEDPDQAPSQIPIPEDWNILEWNYLTPVLSAGLLSEPWASPAEADPNDLVRYYLEMNYQTGDELKTVWKEMGSPDLLPVPAAQVEKWVTDHTGVDAQTLRQAHCWNPQSETYDLSPYFGGGLSCRTTRVSTDGDHLILGYDLYHNNLSALYARGVLTLQVRDDSSPNLVENQVELLPQPEEEPWLTAFAE